MSAPKDRKILLIDDDPLFGNMMRRKAAARGLRLDYNSCLVDALYDEYLEEYDIAIVDCCMLGINGFEVSNYITDFHKMIPVVLISQSQGPFRQYMDDTAGAAAFVSKRYGADAILEAAERQLRRRKQTRDGNAALVQPNPRKRSLG